MAEEQNNRLSGCDRPLLPIQRAYHWALRLHEGQRYGDLPYSAHLEHVNQVIRRFGACDIEPTYDCFTVLSAVWLHDAVEDCGIAVDEIREKLGDAIADLVYAVTDEPGKSRKERKAKTYPKIRVAGKYAVMLKLADRIANTERAREIQSHHLQMYREEYPEFRAALYVPGELDAMWARLDALSEASHE